jgi:hypothetical protein
MKGFTRFFHVLESVQYGLLYMFSAFFGGVALDYIFPRYDENEETKTVLWQTVLQCLCLVIMVYFIRYMIKMVPLFFPIPSFSKFIPYTTPEYSGEMMMGFVFLGSQLNLINKLDLLSKRFYQFIYNEKRDKEISSVAINKSADDDLENDYTVETQFIPTNG